MINLSVINNFSHKAVRFVAKCPSIYRIIKRYPLRYYRNTNLKRTDFSSEVWIENTNHCNTECIICPREIHTRNKRVMDFALYMKIIKEISLYKN
jgi:hypothetical protein